MSYRVRYESIKPGGHVAAEDESVRGDEADLVRFIATHCMGSYCLVTEYRASDSLGTDLTDDYGWTS